MLVHIIYEAQSVSITSSDGAELFVLNQPSCPNSEQFKRH